MTARPSPPSVPAGTLLLGEVVTRTCPAKAVRHADLVAALRAAALDESTARVLAPRARPAEDAEPCGTRPSHPETRRPT